MSVDVGDVFVKVLADTKSLDAHLAKIQRGIQAMRDVLNEEDAGAEPPPPPDNEWLRKGG